MHACDVTLVSKCCICDQYFHIDLNIMFKSFKCGLRYDDSFSVTS